MNIALNLRDECDESSSWFEHSDWYIHLNKLSYSFPKLNFAYVVPHATL